MRRSGTVAEVSRLAVDFNWEAEPARGVLDALLAEYDALRREVEEIKAQLERTYSYLLALFGALAASQFVDTSKLGNISENQDALLVASLATLWFPLNYSLLSIDMNLLGYYLSQVLAPKINFLTSDAASRSDTGSAYLQFSDQTFGKLGLGGVNSWETVRKVALYRPVNRQLVLLLLSLGRIALLYLPFSILYFRAWDIVIRKSSGPAVLTLVLISVDAILLAIVLVSSVSVGSMFAQHRRGGTLLVKRPKN